MTAKNPSKEISLIRVYDASLAAVWDAWTDPGKAAHWWGPRGFTITTHGKDLRPGGHWSYTMHGPDGTNYPNRTLYLVVEDRSKLVYDHGGNDEQPPLFRVTVLFSESQGRTRMEMTMAFETPEAAEKSREVIRQANGNTTWDRLAEYLEKQSTGKETFVINRSFDASIDRMYEAWTRQEHLSQWVPPTGFTMEYIQADIRPGGQAFYVMKGAGMAMYGRARYLEFVEPWRVVYTQQFADEQGNIARHPMAPTWPETMHTHVEFFEEGPGRTRVTLTWQPQGTCTAEELATFVKGRAGMTGGWNGSFDKLEAYLARG